MPRFIAVNDVHAERNREVLVNLDWVEEVRPTKDGGACIYFAFDSVKGCAGQDRIVTDSPYKYVRQRVLGKV